MYKVLEIEDMQWLSCKERPVGQAKDKEEQEMKMTRSAEAKVFMITKL